jgi:Flp pilus assembly protein TadG
MTPALSIGRLRRSRAGTTALEFALLALPFFTLVLGVVEFSRLVWTQTAMQFAVEKAARCAAVNTTLCGSSDQIQQYALSQMLAPGVAATAFTYAYNPSPGCGKSVSATTVFSLNVPGMSSALTLTAQSCYPA